MIKKIKYQISELFEDGKLSNADMVQIIELCGAYLNLQSISDYAKQNGLSYNGVKNHRQIIKLFNQKFVIDNE